MLLTIDKLSRTPIYEQVVAQLEMHIQLGSFSQDQALPSVRSLSLELGVNPNTLQKAYAELERRGLCVSVPGSGRYVTADARERLAARSRLALGELTDLVIKLRGAGVTREEILSCVQSALDAAISTKGETSSS